MSENLSYLTPSQRRYGYGSQIEISGSSENVHIYLSLGDGFSHSMDNTYGNIRAFCFHALQVPVPPWELLCHLATNHSLIRVSHLLGVWRTWERKLHNLGDEVGSGRLHVHRLCSRDVLLKAVSSFLSSASRGLSQALFSRRAGW